MEERKKHGKRRVILVALAACLTVVAAGGVLAWFSAQSDLTNTFTVGNIKPPTTDPENPDKPIDPDNPDNPDNPDKPNLSGNIYEPSWVHESKIGPGATVAKDPYVGIGKGSDNAYVYVYVKNNMGHDSHFALNGDWAAVDAIEYAGNAEEQSTEYYTSGLFVYGTAAKPTALIATADKDAWTSAPLFEAILTPKNADFTGPVEATIEVHAYVAAKSDENSENAGQLQAAAIEWAKSFEPSA